VAGGRHSAQVGVEGPHDHLIVMQQLPQQTCIPEAVMLEAGPAGGGTGILVKALGVAHWSATSGQGCCYGMDFARFQGALGRRLRLGEDGCWSAVRVHGECVMFVTDLTGRWRAGGMVVHCREDQ
jgi:hypothetical protein